MNSALLAVLAAGMTAAIASPSAGASTVAPAIAEQAAACELHVWPSHGLRSTYHGWFHGGIVNGAVTGRDGYPAIPSDPLPAARQALVLKAAPIAEALKLTGFSTTVHPTPLGSGKARRTPGRLLPGTTDCYAELIVDDTFFQQDFVNGKFLKVLFRYRRFDAGDAPVRTFGSYTQVRLQAFPPDQPADDEAARAELNAALVASLTNFAAALDAAARQKKAKR